MKRKILLSLFVVSLLASCSTAYKTGQTPDDVYFSPAKAVTEENKQDKNDEYANLDDNYLRMKVRHYNRWSYIDDYSYWNDSRYYEQNCYNYPYYNTYYGNYYSPYFSYYGWNSYSYYSPYGYYGNSYYNPYYSVVRHNNPKSFFGNTSASNVKSYRNNNYNNNNNKNNNSNSGSSTRTNTSRTFGGSTSPSSSQSSSSTSSSAGGKSGGYSSTGSSSSSGRGGRN